MRPTDYFRVSFGNITRQKLRSSLTIFAVVIQRPRTFDGLRLAKAMCGESSSSRSGAQCSRLSCLKTPTGPTTKKTFQWWRPQRVTGKKLTDGLISQVCGELDWVGCAVNCFDSLTYQRQELTFDNVEAFEMASSRTPSSPVATTAPTDNKDTIVLSDACKGGWWRLRRADWPASKPCNTRLYGNSCHDYSAHQPIDPQQTSKGSPTTLSAKVVGIVASDDAGD